MMKLESSALSVGVDYRVVSVGMTLFSFEKIFSLNMYAIPTYN